MRAMRILALETSTESGSCALWDDGRLYERQCPAGVSHSTTLLPLVQALLAEQALGFAQLDAIAFGAGPGAFTGLRVACGIAQGLAVAHDLPVLPVGTLEAIAWQAAPGRILALLDARMGEVYAATFLRSDDRLEALAAPCVAPPALLPLPAGTEWLACGNALAVYPELTATVTGRGWACRADLLPSAGAVAQLAVPRLAAGEGIDAALAAPWYVRDKVAKTVAERLAEGGHA
jgi:tRNA threonylcarbamoyladenosine biosynthesis protein TsaB